LSHKVEVAEQKKQIDKVLEISDSTLSLEDNDDIKIDGVDSTYEEIDENEALNLRNKINNFSNK